MFECQRKPFIIVLYKNISFLRCTCFEGWLGKDTHCKTKDNTTVHRLCAPGWIGDMCQDKCLNK